MSMAGETDVPLFTYGFFDAPFWEKPEQWIKQSSLAYVGNVKTPTLLMTASSIYARRCRRPKSTTRAQDVEGPGRDAAVQRRVSRHQLQAVDFLRTQLYMMSWYQKHRLGARRRRAPAETHPAALGRDGTG